jgi:hypothetical protein
MLKIRPTRSGPAMKRGFGTRIAHVGSVATVMLYSELHFKLLVRGAGLEPASFCV